MFAAVIILAGKNLMSISAVNFTPTVFVQMKLSVFQEQ
jgi:hypothetical protein